MAAAETSAAALAAVHFKDSKFYKILYIDSDIDEKIATHELESRCNADAALGRLVVFTVVQNAFSGIEAFEYTSFDIIIARKNLHHINAYDLIKIYSAIDVNVPIVLLVEDADYEGRDTGDIVSSTKYAAEDLDAVELGFRAILRSPFSTKTLIDTISNVLKSKFRVGKLTAM